MASIDRRQAVVLGSDSIALWLSAQFMAPVTEHAVRAARTADGRRIMREICTVLGCANEAGALEDVMNHGSAGEVALGLGRRHVMLFEGIFGARSCQPYASMWDGTGRLCGPAVLRMQAILRELDLRLAADIAELPDHIGIQLAALAAAMQHKRPDIVTELTKELAWTDRFARTLSAQEGTAFHGILGRLLLAFIGQLASTGPAWPDGPAPIADHPYTQAKRTHAPALEG